MVQFTKLRLTGFKSFVENTELLIEPGMTGVVGPNGCGKSNLVEALKWVMGETSAKQMRGGEMDDVIFGGSSDRPARNIAEVVITLDNSQRLLPGSFNEHAELAISRRIERGSGSNYKVNGKDVRARDVQLLFADLATGARSTALVSQGRVGALINAKPAQRRSLLEEAAGISGLHTRRHEAELRLRAAEGNLERLEDVLTALGTQFDGLQRQARQAARYRSLSERIRRTEAVVLHLKWVEAVTLMEQLRNKFRDAETRVAELTGNAASASRLQADAASILNPLRQTEAEAGAALHRLIVAREQLDEEEKRIASQRGEAEQRRAQIVLDVAREKERTTDAAEALEALGREQTALTTARDNEKGAGEAARTHLHAVNDQVNGIEADLTRLTETLAAAEARRNAAERRIEELATRRRRLEARSDEITEQRRKAVEEAVGKEELANAEKALADAEKSREGAANAIELTERIRHETQSALEEAREARRNAESAHTKLTAEASALEDLLAGSGDEEGAPIIDSITVTPGYEAALAAALGDDLSAPEDSEASRHWTTLPPLANPPPLPTGAVPLSDLVRAPKALARRLSQVGVVENGEAACASLSQGQRLVDKDGALWRWDGFTMAAGAPTAAAARLRQRNRLAELQSEIAATASALEAAKEKAEKARTGADEASAAERRARDESRQADHALTRAREAHQQLDRKLAAAESRIGTLDETLAGIKTEKEEVAAQIAEAEAARKELQDMSETKAEADRLRASLADKRTALVEARSAYDRLSREAEQRQHRLDTIAREIASWTERRDNAVAHIGDLEERGRAVALELQKLQARPEEIEASRQALLGQTSQAETNRREAADALAKAEAQLADVDGKLKQAEHALAAAREERVRCEGAVEQGKQACQTIAQRISEDLDCTPEKVLEKAELEEGEEIPKLAEAERRHDRAVREREAMGPVNLRAEQEAGELEQQINGLTTEKADLIAAISRLRQGISELNSEGRERLLASFEEVDKHFRSLFTRLFGGGRAHLALTESDDPLDAGLEIMASPPGKRLQTLSLLSGGEQAMTAIALLFAVFLTNPAPICILDEVDAPLDDANVDRFCTMVEELAHSTSTRFLCVTHHRMSMARMDRLFGVTMAERGVSRLVSVDLKAAAELVDS